MGKHGYIGRFYYASPGNVIDFGASSADKAVSSGYYFFQGYSNGAGTTEAAYTETSGNFLRSIANAINNSAGGTPVTACFIDCALAAPKVTITLSAPYYLFIASSLAQILGFSTSADYYVNSASHVASYSPRYCWFPTYAASGSVVDLSQFWEPLSTTKSYRSINGKVYSMQGNLLYGNVVKYSLLPKEDVVTCSTANTYQPLQAFFEDVIHQGQYFRILHDKDNVGSNGYANLSTIFCTAQYGVNEEDVNMTVGNFSTFAEKNAENYQGLWNVELTIMKYV